MKKFTLLFVAIAAITFLLIGCRNSLTSMNGETGSLQFNVNNSVNARAIVPDIDMGVVKIRITGQSQDYSNANFVFEYDYPTGVPEFKEGLMVGKWDITAEGLNAGGYVIGEAFAIADVLIDQVSTVNLVIKPVSGRGNFILSYTDLLNGMDLGNLPNSAEVRVTGSYTKLGGETVEFSGEAASVGSILRDGLELELTDTTFTDTSENVHPIFNNGVTILSDEIFGTVYDFNGIDSWIEFTDFGQYLDKDHGTLSMWINTRDPSSSNDYIFSVSDSPFKRLEISSYNQYIGVGYMNKAYRVYSSKVKFEWYHISMIWDNNVVRTYINKELVNTNTDFSISPYTQSAIFAFGRYCYNGSRYYNGSIAKPRIYSRALSEEENELLYNYDISIIPQLTGQIELSNLDTGWYDLAVQVKSGSVPLSDTIHETFRIVESTDTEAELIMTADEIYVGSADFSVVVDMDNLINVELTTETVGTDIIITATTTDAITGNSVEANLTWYLNGETLADIGSSITIDTTTAGNFEGLEVGVNKVTCRAENEGALGNSHVTFTIE